MKLIYADIRKKQITRDLSILFFLGAGIATIHQIRNKFFIKDNGEKASRQACEKRMNQLCNMGYVLKTQYKRLRSLITVYSLTELGRNEVANNFSVERSHIRIGAPRVDSRLTHELVLGDVARRINEERSLFKITHMYDDIVMKSHAKPAKGIYYPDLFIRILRPQNGPLNICLELDAGTKTAKYWVNKLKSWNDVTLVLTLQEHRLKRLMDYIKRSGIERPTGFAVANRFLKDGLAKTEWEWLPGGHKCRLDLL